MKNKRYFVKHIIIFCLSIIILPSFINREKVIIYTIGDSTMADYDTTRAPLCGWAQILPLFFDNQYIVVDNRGASGRSSKSFIDEGKWQAVKDKLKKGDYVFIQFGHNDAKTEDPKRYTDPQGSYKMYLVQFIEDTRNKGAYPILMTSIVRRNFNEEGILVHSHGQYTDVVRNVAKQMNVPFIDLEEKTYRAVQQAGIEESKKMFMWLEPGQFIGYPEGIQDNTHLCEYGASVVARLAVEGMCELNLSIVKYLNDK